MKINKGFNHKKICPICNTNENKPSTKIVLKINNIMKGVSIHIDCLELKSIEDIYGNGRYLIGQVFEVKNENI